MTARLIRYLWRVAVLQQVAEIVVGELFRHVVVSALSEPAKFTIEIFLSIFRHNTSSLGEKSYE